MQNISIIKETFNIPGFIHYIWKLELQLKTFFIVEVVT